MEFIFSQLESSQSTPIGYNCIFLLALTAEALMRRNRPLLKGWVNLGLNIRLKSYVYRQHLYTIRQGNGSTITLPMEVFTQRNFVADLIRLNLNFIYKNDKFAIAHMLFTAMHNKKPDTIWYLGFSKKRLKSKHFRQFLFRVAIRFHSFLALQKLKHKQKP